MQSSTSTASASPIPVPKIDTDEPVAVIPVASVAPLDGPPDGERINTFALAPQASGSGGSGSSWSLEDIAVDAFGDMRDRVLSKPFTYVLAAFSLGFVLARVMR